MNFNICHANKKSLSIFFFAVLCKTTIERFCLVNNLLTVEQWTADCLELALDPLHG